MMHKITKTINAVSRWIAIRETESKLHRLDDRELNDLGISRHDIPRIARTSVISSKKS